MKIKVGIDWGNVISLQVVPPLFALCINKFYLPLSMYIGLIFYIYFWSIFIFRIFCFYDEYYEVFFPTRIFHRRKRIFYKVDICKTDSLGCTPEANTTS